MNEIAEALMEMAKILNPNTVEEKIAVESVLDNEKIASDLLEVAKILLREEIKQAADKDMEFNLGKLNKVTNSFVRFLLGEEAIGLAKMKTIRSPFKNVSKENKEELNDKLVSEIVKSIKRVAK